MKTLRLDFIKCIIPKSRTMKHCVTFLPDAYLATKIQDMSGKNLTYGNPTPVTLRKMVTRLESQSMTRVRVIFSKISERLIDKPSLFAYKEMIIFGPVMIQIGANFLF